MSWAEYSYSDCIALLNAYKEWLRRKNNREFRNSERVCEIFQYGHHYYYYYCVQLEREWCERNFIRKNVIREVRHVDIFIIITISPSLSLCISLSLLVSLPLSLSLSLSLPPPSLSPPLSLSLPFVLLSLLEPLSSSRLVS